MHDLITVNPPDQSLEVPPDQREVWLAFVQTKAVAMQEESTYQELLRQKKELDQAIDTQFKTLKRAQSAHSHAEFKLLVAKGLRQE